MIEHKDGSADNAALRALAETLLADREIDIGVLSTEEMQAIVHELQVHQIELELQNAEMQRAYRELDALRADLNDLYQLAPVGYIALRSDDVILKANHAAAEMLGTVPDALEGSLFHRFVIPQDQKRYFDHRRHG